MLESFKEPMWHLFPSHKSFFACHTFLFVHFAPYVNKVFWFFLPQTALNLLWKECGPPSFFGLNIPATSLPFLHNRGIYSFFCMSDPKYWSLLGHCVTICSRFSRTRKIKGNRASSSDTSDICGAKAVCTVPEVIGR